MSTEHAEPLVGQNCRHLAAKADCAYNLPVRIRYDPAKNERNIRERALPFDLAAEFDFESARILIDRRREYGETRYIGVGFLRGRLHILCFKEENDGIRVISFRKANAREVKLHAQIKTPD